MCIVLGSPENPKCVLHWITGRTNEVLNFPNKYLTLSNKVWLSISHWGLNLSFYSMYNLSPCKEDLQSKCLQFYKERLITFTDISNTFNGYIPNPCITITIWQHQPSHGFKLHCVHVDKCYWENAIPPISFPKVNKFFRSR